jgi:hypothetical protein
MPYRIAVIDVHKKRLAVVVADVEVDNRRRGASAATLTPGSCLMLGCARQEPVA